MVFYLTGINKINVDVQQGKVIVESHLGSDRVKSLIEGTGRRAVLKGLGGTETKCKLLACNFDPSIFDFMGKYESKQI